MFRGDRLRELRENSGETHEKLSELLSLGSKQIWRYETRATKPDGEVVARLAKFFKVSTDYLLDLTDLPNPPPYSDLSPAGLQAARLIDQIDERLRPAALFALEDTVKELQEKPALVLALLNRMKK